MPVCHHECMMHASVPPLRLCGACTAIVWCMHCDCVVHAQLDCVMHSSTAARVCGVLQYSSMSVVYSSTAARVCGSSSTAARLWGPPLQQHDCVYSSTAARVCGVLQYSSTSVWDTPVQQHECVGYSSTAECSGWLYASTSHQAILPDTIDLHGLDELQAGHEDGVRPQDDGAQVDEQQVLELQHVHRVGQRQEVGDLVRGGPGT